MNPSAKAQQKREQELEHAQTEAERLKKRLDILEENGGAVQDLTMQVDQRMEVPSPSKEIKGKLRYNTFGPIYTFQP